MEAGPRPSLPDVGTEDGFRAFYRQSMPVVYGYLFRLTGGDEALTEDLTQETWYLLIAEIGAGRYERATTSWLLTVARSRFMDSWRRQNRLARPLKLAWASDDPVAAWEPSRSEIVEHLASLPADQRIVLVLRYIDDLDVNETAEIMGRSVTAIHSLLARARRELRARVGGGADG